MKQLKIFLFLVFTGSVIVLPVKAQTYTGLNWAFGDSCGIRFNTSSIDSFYTTSVKSRGTCVSISDSAGNLLFYASSPHLISWLTGVPGDGVVFNKNHQVMENGDSLMTSGWYNEMTIIPNPGHTNQFILFLSGVSSSFFPGIRYCIIDLNQNNGLGKVIQKNVLIDPNVLCDGAIAVKHGNGRDWWFIYRKNNNSNQFNTILITDQGIQTSTLQYGGAIFNAGFTRLQVNANANKIASVSASGLIEIFDFDRCSGAITNPLSIANFQASQPNNTDYYWGLEFSKSGRYLYVCTGISPVYLYQLDLTSASIYNSKYVVDLLGYPLDAASYLKRGPDDKIYRATAWYDGMNYNYPYPDTTYNLYNTHLSVINSPDSAGAACDYQPFSVYLPTCRTYLGLPNNPDYTIGPLVGSPCDTLSIGIKENNQEIKGFNLFPNPFANNFTIERRTGWNQACEISVYDLTGKKITQLHWAYEKRIEIPTTNWIASIYLIKINMNGKSFYLKGVKM